MGLLLAWWGTTTVQAQSDNFDDVDPVTNAAWAKITATNYTTIYSRPADEFGGHAIRLQGATPQPPAFGGGQNDPTTARVILCRTDRIYTNFFVAADLVAWDASTTNDQVFGLVAHAANLDSGLIDGVTFTDRINRFGNLEGSKGQVQIYGFNAGAVGAPAAQNLFTVLVPGRKYRFVFQGTGNVYSGAVYDLEDLTRPLVEMSGDDSFAASAFVNLPYPNAGYSGIFNASLADGTEDPRTDTTFDNFVAAESTPNSVAAPATPHGLAGAPQVVNRTPASFANFHPAANGIVFNATTLTTTNAVNTNAIRLYLNGRDVSSGLSITGPTTNALVAYSGLTANAVYDARIELQDALARRTTNVWTFDTFSEGYLASAAAKNIECEDYDYSYDVNGSPVGSGLFIDNPLPSGMTTNGTPVNADGGGYFGLTGGNMNPQAVNAGADFFDRRAGPESGAYANYAMFRPNDAVGTEQGKANYLYVDQFGTVTFDYSVNRTYGPQRQKYSAANPALKEYAVVQTTGGEWMNYTRVFSNSNYYHVYLRYACGFSQDLGFDQIGPGPTTNRLGTFSATNQLWLNNYRYGPLRDEAGRPAVVNLSGTNTLRLTVLGADLNPTRYALALDYLAFVPALLVESAAQAAGPYLIENAATIEPGTRHITLPVSSGSSRFYRLRWDHPVNITDIKLANGNVELHYQ